MISYAVTQWTEATGRLLPGPQRAFLDILKEVAAGNATLVHGQDERNGSPCLVNAVQNMLSDTEVSPIRAFRDVVICFDVLCKELFEAGLADRFGYVSDTMAEVLIKHFGEVKPMEVSETMDAPYVERSDADMAEFLRQINATDRTDVTLDVTNEVEVPASLRRSE